MRVLVVGGTGGFGSTIARRLAEEAHDVVAASRNRPKSLPPGVEWIGLDRDRITTDDLATYDVVVDAAGPFRSQNRRLARTCIEARVHHLDIADDRAFVRGVAELDEAARHAGVVCVSGASSVPGLSSAVVLETARGMDHVDMVEIAISASNRAAFGRSVLDSMLSGAGRPIRRTDGTTGTTMSDPRVLSIDADGHAPMRRTVLEVDGPDQDDLPILLPDRPSVRFRAGGELAVHNLAMRVVSSLVRHGIVRSGTTFSALAQAARRPTSSFGDGRSAMVVEVFGLSQGRRIVRRWELVAERNAGPEIPCLVVPEIVARIAEGVVPSGARSAAGMVASGRVLSRMPPGTIAIRTDQRDAPALYEETVVGYERLPGSVRAMHDPKAVPLAVGEALVEPGTGLVARTVARIVGLPTRPGRTPLSVEFDAWEGGERWTRDFGGHRFSSTFERTGTGIRERFGPMSFEFRLEEQEGRLLMLPHRWSAFGVPMPKRLMPSGMVAEFDREGVFRFDVEISAWPIGRIVRYRGELTPLTRRSSTSRTRSA